MAAKAFRKETEITSFWRERVSMPGWTRIDWIGDLEDIRGEPVRGSSSLSGMVSGEGGGFDIEIVSLI
jgi:hypothetical protein